PFPPIQTPNNERPAAPPPKAESPASAKLALGLTRMRADDLGGARQCLAETLDIDPLNVLARARLEEVDGMISERARAQGLEECRVGLGMPLASIIAKAGA